MLRTTSVLTCLAVALTCLAVALCTTEAIAESFEFSLLAGYRVGGTAEGADAEDTRTLEIEASASGTAALSYAFSPYAQVEIMFGWQPSNLKVTPQQGEPQSVDIDVFHYLVNGVYTAGIPQARTRPFAFLGLGATQFRVPNGDEVRFSVSIGGGAKHFVTPTFGLRGQIRFSSTYLTERTNLHCEEIPGSTTCFPVRQNDYVHQWDFSAGVILAF
jgi:hypothetical protein